MTACSNGDGRPVRAKGLCARCYARDYARDKRATPANRQRASGAGVVLPVIKLDLKLDLLLRAAVELEGVTLAAWVRDAIRERVLRQSAKHPELMHLGAALKEPPPRGIRR